MFERFTESARHVVVLAQEEARRLRHNYIGTEHLLLGLLREEEGLAGQILASLGITPEKARRQVERIVGTGEDPSSDQIPFTPRAKRVLALALSEALSLNHNYIGTEHVLLGMIREDEGVGRRILLDFDADPVKVRNEVLRQLPQSNRSARAAGFERFETTVDPGWLDGLVNVLAPLGAEIRAQLERPPDVGDLLVACACVPDTPAYEALSKLGVDIDQLRGEIEEARARDHGEQQQLAFRIRNLAEAKELAIEEQRLADAALLRDQERELREEVQARHDAQLAALQKLRRHLGLTASGDS